MNILITGCAGFIGSHLSESFLKDKIDVIGIDNLSRKGSNLNLTLLNNYSNFKFFKIDIRDNNALLKLFKNKGPFDLIIHQAAQVAVTTSIINPREDYETNVLGTFNLLEATRLVSPKSVFQFASTNKVYGKLDNVNIIELNEKYEYENLKSGINENFHIDFHSPYGCSKGSADQYVRDYNRIYGLNTVVFRQSCIYGDRQFGVEDQGWVSWFTIASILKKQITLYGDGKQARDLLWIDDLVNLYKMSYFNSDKVSGKIFNVGGGMNNTLSLNQLLNILKSKELLNMPVIKSNWRNGDQKIFISDISSVSETLNWKPQIDPIKGVNLLIDWTNKNKNIISSLLR
jgi:CDP-paratose 2-epimerase